MSTLLPGSSGDPARRLTEVHTPRGAYAATLMTESRDFFPWSHTGDADHRRGTRAPGQVSLVPFDASKMRSARHLGLQSGHNSWTWFSSEVIVAGLLGATANTFGLGGSKCRHGCRLGPQSGHNSWTWFSSEVIVAGLLGATAILLLSLRDVVGVNAHALGWRGPLARSRTLGQRSPSF